MSYILDALRKADSERERERGAVPSIHAQPAPPSAADPDEPGKGQPLVWVVAGLSVVVLALLAWMFLGRSSGGDEPQPARVAEAPVAAPPAPPMPAPMPQQAPVPMREVAPPRAVAPEPVRVQTPPQASPPNMAAPHAAAPQTPPQTAPVAQPVNRAADDRVLTMDELPDDVRRQLPNFAINGSKYSDTPASRILIINGQVFHEGDRLTPDLTLEQIKVKAAVLRFRGYRYSMTF